MSSILDDLKRKEGREVKATIEETLQSIDDTLKRIEKFLHENKSISIRCGVGECDTNNLVKKDVNITEIKNGIAGF